MTYQRQHGQPIKVWVTERVTDSRGNVLITCDTSKPPLHERAVFVPDRASRAEIAGQLEIDVYRAIVRQDVTNISSWSIIEWEGHKWDVISPPERRHGVRRHTRHWTMLVRRRP